MTFRTATFRKTYEKRRGRVRLRECDKGYKVDALLTKISAQKVPIVVVCLCVHSSLLRNDALMVITAAECIVDGPLVLSDRNTVLGMRGIKILVAINQERLESGKFNWRESPREEMLSLSRACCHLNAIFYFITAISRIILLD